MTNVDILSSNGVNIESSLELLGDMEMYNETLDDFLLEMEERIPKIEEYKELGDLPNYAILVHALKSDSKYLGFEKLAEISLDHELKSKDHDINYIDNHYEELTTEINRVVNIASKYLGK